MDGSSGHSMYKVQQPGDPSQMNLGRHLFAITMNVLAIVDPETSTFLYKNSCPGSPFSARPIKFVFEKGKYIKNIDECRLDLHYKQILRKETIVFSAFSNISISEKNAQLSELSVHPSIYLCVYFIL